MTISVPEHFFRQSGAIPWRRRATDGEIEVALVSSASGSRWVIPKGVIDQGQTARESAIREAEEEAGLVGRLSAEPVGSYSYDKWGGTCRVEVFLLEVQVERDSWPEREMRERKWFDLEAAANSVREEGLRWILRALTDLVESQ